MDSLFYLGAIVAIYFLPVIIASSRGKSNTLAIGMLNLLLGWTLIGWVVAMVWACTFEGIDRGEVKRENRLGGLSSGAKACITIFAGLLIVGLIGAFNDEGSEESAGGKAVAESLPESPPIKSSPDEAESSDKASDPPREVSPWDINTDISPIDDSKTVYVRTHSIETIAGRLGRLGRATLLLRCMENTTTLMISFADQFMADSGGYGQVTYRVDDATARTVDMYESTDNEWLGLWSGGRSIPVIKRLFSHEKFVVRATPFNEPPVTVTFYIKGIKKEIKPLREACHW